MSSVRNGKKNVKTKINSQMYKNNRDNVDWTLNRVEFIRTLTSCY